MFFLPSRYFCISYAPENPVSSRASIFSFFSFFNRVWHSVGSLKKRKKKKEGGRKKGRILTTNENTCQTSLSVAITPFGRAWWIGRTLKINLSGIESVQRLYLDSVERAELHLGFNRAWKWRSLISRNFLRMILSFFYYYYYYFLKINPSFYSWLSNYNLFEYTSFFRG